MHVSVACLVSELAAAIEAAYHHLKKKKEGVANAGKRCD
jgi:hypothetical protein